MLDPYGSAVAVPMARCDSDTNDPVADPGPLMLGVLDRWTPTVNVLQTLIAQISFHIELGPLEARDSISL